MKIFRIIRKLFNIFLIAAVGSFSLVAPAKAEHEEAGGPPNFRVYQIGDTAVAGTPKAIGIQATTNGFLNDTTYAGNKTVTFTSTDTGAIFGTITTFVEGNATVDVTFSKAGSFTVTATETGGLVGTDTFAVLGFMVTTSGTLTAGTAQEFIIKYGNGVDALSGYHGSKTVKFTSTDSGATFGTITLFDKGVAKINVTFSKAGSFTVTATEADGTSAVGTSVAIGVAGFLITTSGTVTAGTAEIFTITATSNGSTAITDFAGTVDASSSDSDVTIGSITAFASGVATVFVTFSEAGSFTITATQTGGEGLVGTSAAIAVAAAAVIPSPSSSGSESTTVTTPDTTPAPTPGFFSGAKWTITVDDAGVSTLDINLAKSQAGKNASFYKRTKQGKLILLDEEQRLGKNGEASITTDKLLRTGQKVRVQVDGKFRSTVTMP